MFVGKVERWRNVYPPNPAMLRLLLVREDYESYQWGERLGAFYNWHFHEEDQIHWVISGELEITFRNFGQIYTYILKAGDRDFIPARMYHTARIVGETDLLYLIGIKRKPKVAIEIIEEQIVIVAEPTIIGEATPKVKKTRAKAKTTKPKAVPKTRKKK